MIENEIKYLDLNEYGIINQDLKISESQQECKQFFQSELLNTRVNQTINITSNIVAIRILPSIDPLLQVSIILTDDLKLIFYNEKMNLQQNQTFDDTYDTQITIYYTINLNQINNITIQSCYDLQIVRNSINEMYILSFIIQCKGQNNKDYLVKYYYYHEDCQLYVNSSLTQIFEMTDLNCLTHVRSDKIILLRFCKYRKSDKLEIWRSDKIEIWLWKDESFILKGFLDQETFTNISQVQVDNYYQDDGNSQFYNHRRIIILDEKKGLFLYNVEVDQNNTLHITQYDQFLPYFDDYFIDFSFNVNGFMNNYQSGLQQGIALLSENFISYYFYHISDDLYLLDKLPRMLHEKYYLLNLISQKNNKKNIEFLKIYNNQYNSCIYFIIQYQTQIICQDKQKKYYNNLFIQKKQFQEDHEQKFFIQNINIITIPKNTFLLYQNQESPLILNYDKKQRLRLFEFNQENKSTTLQLINSQENQFKITANFSNLIFEADQQKNCQIILKQGNIKQEKIQLEFNKLDNQTLDTYIKFKSFNIIEPEIYLQLNSFFKGPAAQISTFFQFNKSVHLLKDIVTSIPINQTLNMTKIFIFQYQEQSYNSYQFIIAIIYEKCVEFRYYAKYFQSYSYEEQSYVFIWSFEENYKAEQFEDILFIPQQKTILIKIKDQNNFVSFVKLLYNLDDQQIFIDQLFNLSKTIGDKLYQINSGNLLISFTNNFIYILSILNSKYYFNRLQFEKQSQYISYDLSLFNQNILLGLKSNQIDIIYMDFNIHQKATEIWTLRYDLLKLQNENMIQFSFVIVIVDKVVYLLVVDFQNNRIFEYILFKVTQPQFTREYSTYGAKFKYNVNIQKSNDLIFLETIDNRIFIYSVSSNSNDNLIKIYNKSNNSNFKIIQDLDQFSLNYNPKVYSYYNISSEYINISMNFPPYLYIELPTQKEDFQKIFNYKIIATSDINPQQTVSTIIQANYSLFDAFLSTSHNKSINEQLQTQKQFGIDPEQFFKGPVVNYSLSGQYSDKFILNQYFEMINEIHLLPLNDTLKQMYKLQDFVFIIGFNSIFILDPHSIENNQTKNIISYYVLQKDLNLKQCYKMSTSDKGEISTIFNRIYTIYLQCYKQDKDLPVTMYMKYDVSFGNWEKAFKNLQEINFFKNKNEKQDDYFHNKIQVIKSFLIQYSIIFVVKNENQYENSIEIQNNENSIEIYEQRNQSEQLDFIQIYKFTSKNIFDDYLTLDYFNPIYFKVSVLEQDTFDPDIQMKKHIIFQLFFTNRNRYVHYLQLAINKFKNDSIIIQTQEQHQQDLQNLNINNFSNFNFLNLIHTDYTINNNQSTITFLTDNLAFTLNYALPSFEFQNITLYKEYLGCRQYEGYSFLKDQDYMLILCIKTDVFYNIIYQKQGQETSKYIKIFKIKDQQKQMDVIEYSMIQAIKLKDGYTLFIAFFSKTKKNYNELYIVLQKNYDFLVQVYQICDMITIGNNTKLDSMDYNIKLLASNHYTNDIPIYIHINANTEYSWTLFYIFILAPIIISFIIMISSSLAYRKIKQRRIEYFNLKMSNITSFS